MGTRERASEFPNILLITADQHRADSLGAYGNPLCRTPNLDRLAKQGIRMTNAYSPNPICMPARACLATGLATHRHGVYRNGIPLTRDCATLADILQSRGYRTGAVGKLHFTPQLEGVPEAPYYGFQHLVSVEDNMVGPYLEHALANYPEFEDYLIGSLNNLPRNPAYWDGRDDLREEVNKRKPRILEQYGIAGGAGIDSPLPEDAHPTSFITDRAVEFLRAAAGRQPFFLWVSYVDPHGPMDPPGRFKAQYDPEAVDPPKKKEEESAGFCEHTRRRYESITGWSESDWRRIKALYYGSVSFVDDRVGHLLDYAEQHLDMENTLVLYTSDHGELLGDHGLMGKTAYHYDGCIRVPLLCRWDGHWESGKSRQSFVELTDIVPTLLDACGLAAPSPLDGISFHPLLAGNTREGERDHAVVESFFASHVDPADRSPHPAYWARTVRSEAWRATFYLGYAYGELFDLRKDPEEFENLWSSPSHQPVKDHLYRTLVNRGIVRSPAFPVPAYYV